jgi:hypothetical protein
VGNSVRIGWRGVFSDYFLATNGVKQGGVLSPVLFCVYIDDMLLALKKEGVGCYIGNMFVGALAYADDIVIIAPSVSAMRRLLHVCDTYANEYQIMFNAQKSKCLAFLPRSRHFVNDFLTCGLFYIGNNQIEVVKSYSHLGHLININLSDDDDIYNRRFSFIGQVNNVLCYFRKLDSSVKYKLFNSYCTSFFGCELWSLSNESINSFATAWRKGCRRVWNLPRDTHCHLLPLLNNCLPVFDEICKRSLNFIRSCMQHESSLIRFLTYNSIYIARHDSPIGRNALFCMNRYSCSMKDVTSGNIGYFVEQYCHNQLTSDQKISAGFLIELVALRERKLALPDTCMLTMSELRDIIDYVCTS